MKKHKLFANGYPSIHSRSLDTMQILKKCSAFQGLYRRGILFLFFFMPWTQSESEFNNMGDIVMFFLRELLASCCLDCNEKTRVQGKSA